MDYTTFLAVLDDALAARPRRRYVLELRNPHVLGQRGIHLGAEAEGPVYGYTARQCRRMQAAVNEAVREDMAAVQGAAG